MAAIFALPDVNLGAFVTSGHGKGAARGVLSAAILEQLSSDPDWTLEGKGNRLVIGCSKKPQDPSGDMSVREIKSFVDGAFRFAELFGARFSQQPAET